jgi:hypothetical protein
MSDSAIQNTSIDLLQYRTSSPHSHEASNACTFIVTSDRENSSNVNEIWDYLRPCSSSNNSKILRYYRSISVRTELLTRAQLADQSQAMELMKIVYPLGKYVPLLQNTNPPVATGLGMALHDMEDGEEKLFVVAMACRGTFAGAETWAHLHTMLVEGGWPWLRGYSPAYAKMVYTVMALIFSGIENYQFDDMLAMKARLLGLAGKLVGAPPGFPGFSPWRMMKSPCLKGRRLTIPMTISVRIPNIITRLFLTCYRHANTK